MNNFLKLVSISLCLVFLLVLGACKTPQSSMSENDTNATFIIDSGGKRIVTDAKSVEINDTSRIISIGTATSETIVALGAKDRIVGIDNPTAEYVTELKDVPKVGARNALATEGILSLKPTLVIMNADSASPQNLDQLKAANLTTLVLPTNYTIDTVKAKVKTIAHALKLDAKGDELTSNIDRQMIEVNDLLKKTTSKPKVMFVGRGPNMPNATMSGAGTTIDEMIKLAGGVNPFTDFQGFREMTDEAVVVAQPDAILITQRSFERSGGVDGVLQFPGIMQTPVGKNRQVIPVSDMYFQGFGPGVGKALLELVPKFHPELQSK